MSDPEDVMTDPQFLPDEPTQQIPVDRAEALRWGPDDADATTEIQLPSEPEPVPVVAEPVAAGPDPVSPPEPDPEHLSQPETTAGPAPVTVKQGWAKPALVGGIIGALISGGITGGAVLATRSKDDKGVAPRVAAVSRPDAATASSLVVVTEPDDIVVSNSSSSGSASAATPAGGNTLKRAYERARSSVVSINTKGFDPQSSFGVEPSSGAGSGIVLSKDGLILTNNHVVENATSIKVTFSDRSQKTATLVGTDPANDVALIKVSGVSNLDAAPLGTSSKLEVGDPVVAIGNALALPGGPTVTTGIISALEREIADDSASFKGLIQTDAAINPGNSGGPLVNLEGEVVGMNTAIIQNSNNIGFAIAIDRIKPIIQDIQKNGSKLAASAFLGVVTQTVTAQVQSDYGLAVGKGALVVRVEPGSPAADAGLASGDVITEFDTKTVTSAEELGTAVRAKAPNEKVDVVWRRGEDVQQATVELGARGLTSG